MSITVLKIGGSILVDRSGYASAAQRMLEHAVRGPTWSVVSAAKGVTDCLVALSQHQDEAARQKEAASLLELHRALAGQRLPVWIGRELRRAIATAHDPNDGHPDSLLAWGERASAEILRMHLRRLGSAAAIVEMRPRWPSRIHGLAIVPGFYHRESSRRVRTLPRGGSDIAAVYVAYRLGAAEVRFWKEGGGIHGPSGSVVATMDASALLQKIGTSIRPLHPAAVRLAMAHGIQLVLEDPEGAHASTRVEVAVPPPQVPRVVMDPGSRGLRSAWAEPIIGAPESPAHGSSRTDRRTSSILASVSKHPAVLLRA